jgi:predicted ATP-binding protein involved in virulence
MKFHINKVVLWLKNGKVREITFKPNKVNVITGDSSTGKTEILNIVDYCFFFK